MKRVSIYLVPIILLLLVSSCSKKVYYSLGMSENDFLIKNRKAVSLYKKSLNSSTYLQGDGYDGSWFYYFNNGILTELNQGQRQSDFILENRNR
ncbi:hypothetical protein ABE426_09060 [Sphingobacterium faecium]|uniref:hypothetical protein n=1 Tax=Sphingobacterium faecium TaxID=34087 RepID=UPI00320BB4F6